MSGPPSVPLGDCRAAVVGLGLIGSSLAAALRKSGALAEVAGYARNPKTVEEALRRGIVDRASSDLNQALAGADLVCVATPVGTLAELFPRLRETLPDSCAVCDAGSVKGAVVAAARSAYGRIPPQFVPSHPVAGSERSGIQACDDKLFEGSVTVLTPVDETDGAALAKVASLWRTAGSRVVLMDAQRHDLLLGATSHLPHLLAYAFMRVLSEDSLPEQWRDVAGSGLRDFSRIALSSPQMWTEILRANQEAVLDLGGRFVRSLQAALSELEADDAEALEGRLKVASQSRRELAEVRKWTT